MLEILLFEIEPDQTLCPQGEEKDRCHDQENQGPGSVSCWKEMTWIPEHCGQDVSPGIPLLEIFV
jgi:hypothetical protein